MVGFAQNRSFFEGFWVSFFAFFLLFLCSVPKINLRKVNATALLVSSIFIYKKFEIYALEERYKAVLGCLEEIIRAELNKLSVR
jgi:hypothetical protein